MKKSSHYQYLLSVVVAIAALCRYARATEYNVDLDADNSVVFVSDAPLDDFEGVTDRIDGYVIFDGDSLRSDGDYANSELYFEVDLASLDTGIGLRNRHMRENYLETDTYPYAGFRGVIAGVEACGSDSCLVRADGTMSIHGVDRSMRIPCAVTSTGDGYRIRSEFTVKLPDFKIDVPSLMFMKISEEIVLKLDFEVRKVADAERSSR